MIPIKLELTNFGNVYNRMDPDDIQEMDVIDSIGRKQMTKIVNESGLYAMIFQSKKKKAKDFKRWITKEVIPSIRKTGGYNLNKNYSSNENDAKMFSNEFKNDMLNVIKSMAKLISNLPEQFNNDNKKDETVIVSKNDSSDNELRILTIENELQRIDAQQRKKRPSSKMEDKDMFFKSYLQFFENIGYKNLIGFKDKVFKEDELQCIFDSYSIYEDSDDQGFDSYQLKNEMLYHRFVLKKMFERKYTFTDTFFYYVNLYFDKQKILTKE